MLVVGLTGGIGSGKTTVSDLFKDTGVPIIDADVISRYLTAAGQPALKPIATHFGNRIFTSQGELDRRQLREIIFKNPAEKSWLENFLHPLIKKEITSAIQRLDAPYCITSIPLLAETGPYDMLDRILVVDANQDMVIDRVTKRDHISKDQATRIVESQAKREARLQLADDIITNNDSLSALTKKVQALDQCYRKLAQRKMR